MLFLSFRVDCCGHYSLFLSLCLKFIYSGFSKSPNECVDSDMEKNKKPKKKKQKTKNVSSTPGLNLISNLLEKPQRLPRNLRHLRLERKMPGVDQPDLRPRQVPLERLRARRHERRVPLPPDGQQRDLRRAEIRLERRVFGDVGAVVVEERQLAVLIGRAPEVGEEIVRVGGRVDAGEVGGGHAGGVLVRGGFGRQDAGADGGVVVRGRVGPEGFDGVPEGVAEAVGVGVAVLADDGFDAGGVGEGEAEADGGAVVEDVHGVGADVEGGEEGADCEGEVVEGEGIVGGVGGQSEAGEVGGQDVVVGG